MISCTGDTTYLLFPYFVLSYITVFHLKLCLRCFFTILYSVEQIYQNLCMKMLIFIGNVFQERVGYEMYTTSFLFSCNWNSLLPIKAMNL